MSSPPPIDDGAQTNLNEVTVDEDGRADDELTYWVSLRFQRPHRGSVGGRSVRLRAALTALSIVRCAGTNRARACV